VEKEKKQLTKGAASGIVALIFLILGFQLAIFFMKVVQKPFAQTDIGMETVAEMQPRETPIKSESTTDAKVRKSGRLTETKRGEQFHKSPLGGYGDAASVGNPFTIEPRRFESFPFDPNTISVDSLVQLGLSRKQAESIENYRSKGGKFRKKEDFAKMYVVSDTLFERLSPYIDIPRLDLNSADSTALVGLKGIGPYYARRIMEYRTAIGGFHHLDQLMEIRGMDSEKIDGFRESVRIDTALVRKFNIWRASDSKLSAHPYIGERTMRRINRFKSVYDTTQWNYSALLRDRVVDSSTLCRLKPYLSFEDANSTNL